MAVMDGRTWFRHEPEFASIITIMTISASELDLMELGPRVGSAYVQEFCDRVSSESIRHARLLHPVERKR